MLKPLFNKRISQSVKTYQIFCQNITVYKTKSLKISKLLIIALQDVSTAQAGITGGPTSLLSQIIVLPHSKRGKRYAWHISAPVLMYVRLYVLYFTLEYHYLYILIICWTKGDILHVQDLYKPSLYWNFIEILFFEVCFFCRSYVTKESYKIKYRDTFFLESISKIEYSCILERWRNLDLGS